uniref:Uncharacterized protein n=1 Tax=Panagrolaimus superbus TaxID=310955 RepID=A0A914Y3N6_9BILA
MGSTGVEDSEGCSVVVVVASGDDGFIGDKLLLETVESVVVSSCWMAVVCGTSSVDGLKVVESGKFVASEVTEAFVGSIGVFVLEFSGLSVEEVSCGFCDVGKFETDVAGCSG